MMLIQIEHVCISNYKKTEIFFKIEKSWEKIWKKLFNTVYKNLQELQKLSICDGKLIIFWQLSQKLVRANSSKLLIMVYAFYTTEMNPIIITLL